MKINPFFSTMDYGQVEFKTNKFQQEYSWTKIVHDLFPKKEKKIDMTVNYHNFL